MRARCGSEHSDSKYGQKEGNGHVKRGDGSMRRWNIVAEAREMLDVRGC